MSVQQQKSSRRTRGQAATAVSGAVVNAREDADVAQWAAAEVEARAAYHRAKVAEAAYFIAEKRGFGPGHELEDWLAAQAEIEGTCPAPW
jgi:hypothetical protein